MMGQALGDAGITDRNEFRRGEALQIGPPTDTANAYDRREDPEEIDREERQRIPVFILQRGQDVVAHIQKDDGKIPQRDPADDVMSNLEAIREQREERDEEMSKENSVEPDIPPLVGGAVMVQLAQVVPEGFLGDVGVPD